MMPWLRLPCPVVVTFYDTIPLSLPHFWPVHQRAMFSLAHRLSFRCMARGMVMSESAKHDFVSLLGAPADRLELVPPGVEQGFTPQKADVVQRFKSAHGLESDYLLYVGINKPSKNLVRLVQAYARMRGSCPPPVPPLVIAGPWDNRYPEPLQAAAAEGVENWIRFIGPVPEVDLPALYCGARFCVCPSLQEGFGFPVLEAMACGAPVACSRTSSLPEVAGEAAYYFDPERVDQMAEVLMRMTMDAQLRDALRALGLKRAEQFDWEGTARRTVGVYRLALEPPADPSPRQRTPIAINESCA
jgi:alpha-1,3-rhamnosyl/mannosyltransferase